MKHNLCSRKFLIAMIVVIMTFISLWLDKISSEVFSTIVMSVVGGYHIVNNSSKDNVSRETKEEE